MAATNYMQQGPCEAGNCSVSQKIPYLPWNLNVCYHYYMYLPWNWLLILLDPVHTLVFLKMSFEIHFNIILFCISYIPHEYGIALIFAPKI